ncbi:unnamed protein product [Sphagnum tenellum]
MTCLLALSGAGGGSVDAGDGVTSVPHLNEHQFPAWSTVLSLAMMELEMLHRLFCPAASMMLFTQHSQDKQYVSALQTIVLQRLALPCLHHSLPSVLNTQISLLEYMKSTRGFQ